jgi:hypothetical protein
MISDETLEVRVKYGSRYTFFLREISMAEEQKLRSKNFGLSDDETAAKEYDQNVSILRDLSTKKPTAAKSEDEVQEFDLVDFFTDRTPRKERIAFYAVRGYFIRLLPEESF